MSMTHAVGDTPRSTAKLRMRAHETCGERTGAQQQLPEHPRADSNNPLVDWSAVTAESANPDGHGMPDLGKSERPSWGSNGSQRPASSRDLHSVHC